MLEQFEPGHRRGSSSDHSRIIRHSYHSPVYTRLTRAMFCVLGRRGGARAGRGSSCAPAAWTSAIRRSAAASPTLEASASAMSEAGIAFERLTADDVRAALAAVAPA